MSVPFALEGDVKLEVSPVKEATNDKIQQVHVRELAIQDDMIRLFQEKATLLEKQVTTKVN